MEDGFGNELYVPISKEVGDEGFVRRGVKNVDTTFAFFDIELQGVGVGYIFIFHFHSIFKKQNKKKSSKE